MKLRLEFETVGASLLNRNPVPSLNVCSGELLSEEHRLAIQLGITQETMTIKMVKVAYVARGKGNPRHRHS